MSTSQANKADIPVIILAAGRDFGRCPIASRVPSALWPVVDKPVLVRLLSGLARQGIKRATICSHGDTTLLKQAVDAAMVRDMDVEFLDEPLPVGTAGSIRDAVKDRADGLLVVMSGSIVYPPDINVLVTSHRARGADLTVVLNLANGGGQAANVYVCERAVLEHIPAQGYFDIKESLVPELVRAGKRVCPLLLSRGVSNFRDRQSYLGAIGDYLEDGAEAILDMPLWKRDEQRVIWKGEAAKIAPSAKFYGKVAVLDGAAVCEDAVIFGPTVIGRNVTIGKDSVIVGSVLWDGSTAGGNCEVQHCVVDYDAVIRTNSVVRDEAVVFKAKGAVSNVLERMTECARGALDKAGFSHRKSDGAKAMSESARASSGGRLPLVAVAFVIVAFLWSYWPGIVDLWRVWQRSDEYSSGLLVPFLAVYVLWSERERLRDTAIRPCIWGLVGFLVAQAVRYFGLFFMYGSAERLSIVLSIWAIVLLLFGWRLFRKVWPVLLFLVLMAPWPNRVQQAVALPLQRWATVSAVFCLEVVGYAASHEGNLIHIGRTSVAVAEACNGLRMVTAFFVVSGLVVLLVKRPWWQKVVVFISSVPIALLCNTIRLAITAVAFTFLEGEQWETIFHDFGGYAMMPLAIALAVAEFWILARLTTPAKQYTQSKLCVPGGSGR